MTTPKDVLSRMHSRPVCEALSRSPRPRYWATRMLVAPQTTLKIRLQSEVI